MQYYIVERIGDGTRGNPYRPNTPSGVDFVWSDNQCSTCETYLLASNVPISGITQITDLESACISRDLILGDVEKWFVGD